MKEYLHKISELARFRKYVPFILLVVLLSLTVYSWLLFINVKAKEEWEIYEEYTKQIVSKVDNQLHHYAMLLQGGASLFAVFEEVTRDEWRMYCEYQQVRTLFPGIQGIGFSRVVLPSELARHIQGIRAEGYPDYTLWPAGERNVYTAITFLEPFDARNQRAFGYDMFSEPVRRTAMKRARDTGAISMSGKVTLVQETDKNVQAGFLMYVPIYAKGIPLNTIEERRAALIGYVYSPFRMNDFLGKILPGSQHDIEFTIYDGTEISSADLMYECDEPPIAPDEKHKPMFSSQQTVDLFGHQWTLAFETRPSFGVAFDQLTSWSILASGLAISLLIFLFTRQQEKSRKGLDVFATDLRLTSQVTEEKSEKLKQALTDAADIGDRLNTILTSISDGIVVTNHENKVVLMNATAETLLGLQSFQIEGKPLHFAIDDPTLRDQMRVALEEHEPGYQFDFEISGDQSSRHRILRAKTAKVVKIESKSENRDKLVIIIRDVTIEREIEAGLEKTRKELEVIKKSADEAHELADSIINTVREPLISLDQNLRVVTGSRSFYDFFKVKPEETVAQLIYDLGNKQWDIPKLRELLENILPEKTAFDNYEVEHDFATIGKRTMLLNARQIKRAMGKKRIILLAIEDITKRKEIETGLEESRKELEIMKNIAEKSRKEAELANTAKSAFLANMSHEIRTPMNSVLGFIQIVLEDNMLSDKHRKHLEIAYGSAHNLLTIINDILDVSKLESDNFELEIINFNLPQAIEKILRTLEPSAKEKDIALVFDFDGNLPHCYLGDPIRLGQVILNLVGNAIKFTKTGNINISVRASDQGGDLLHFTVADTGIGMTPEQTANIFSRFTQADVSTARRFGGTGLGLAIAHQIVEFMGGQIWVESELGNGSIFHFTAQLPKAPNTSAYGNHGFTMEVTPLKSMRRFQILLAEDIVENAILAKLRLEQQGHTVRHAWNGREAVELYNTATYDLILMDVSMPEMDGIEATRKIRELEEESNTHITIIALTASVMSEDREICIKAGMDAVVGKPINLEELFSTMEKVVPDGIGMLNDDIFVDFQEKPEIDFTPLAHIVDIEKGLAVWQDSLFFAKSLTSFIDGHSNDALKIEQLLSEGNLKEAKMITHALKGVAGNLFLSKVAQWATEIDALLKTGTDEQTENLIPRLQEALKNATEAIKQLKIPVLKESCEPTRGFDSKAVSRLLQKLLDMLEEDNPDVAEPVLNRLKEYVPLKDTVRVSKAIDDFDFDQAKAQTKILAEKLGIKLER